MTEIPRRLKKTSVLENKAQLLEVECQLDIARELQYITNDEAKEVSAQISKVAALIAGLRNKRVGRMKG